MGEPLTYLVPLLLRKELAGAIPLISNPAMLLIKPSALMLLTWRFVCATTQEDSTSIRISFFILGIGLRPDGDQICSVKNSGLHVYRIWICGERLESLDIGWIGKRSAAYRILNQFQDHDCTGRNAAENRRAHIARHRHLESNDRAESTRAGERRSCRVRHNDQNRPRRWHRNSGAGWCNLTHVNRTCACN